MSGDKNYLHVISEHYCAECDAPVISVFNGMCSIAKYGAGKSSFSLIKTTDWWKFVWLSAFFKKLIDVEKIFTTLAPVQ